MYAVVTYRSGKAKLSQPMSWSEAYESWSRRNKRSKYAIAIRELDGADRGRA